MLPNLKTLVCFERSGWNSSFHEKVRGCLAFLVLQLLYTPFKTLNKTGRSQIAIFLSEDLAQRFRGTEYFCFEGDVIDVGSPSSFVNCNQLFSSSKSSEEFDFDRKWVSRHRNQISMLEECFFGNPKE